MPHFHSLHCIFRTLLAIEVKSAKTTTQLTSIQRRQTALLRKVQRFREVQQAYMPMLSRIMPHALGQIATTTPELISLFLPSSLDSTTRPSVCLAGIVEIEDQLQFAKAHECLVDLRSQLLKRSLGHKYKAKNQASQRAYTRFRTLQDQTESKIKVAQSLYDQTRAALFALRGPGDWERILQILRPADVRSLNEVPVLAEEVEDGRDSSGHPRNAQLVNVAFAPVESIVSVGQKSRTLSWIWYTTAKEERGQEEIDNGVCFGRWHSLHV